MNTTQLLAPILLTALASGCGGGGISASAASGLLLDQWGECFAVAAGRVGADRFNAAAAEIAAVPAAEVCAAWPAGHPADCNAAYRELSRPFTDAAQCKLAPG